MKSSAIAQDSKNRGNKVNLKRFAIFALIALVVLVGLLFWARDVIREVIVLPLSYLVWVIGVLVDTTPQVFFWISGAILAALIIISAFTDRPKAMLRTPLPDLPDRLPGNGRVTYWQVRTRYLRGGQGAYYERMYTSSLNRLLVEMLAYRFRLTGRQVEDQLRAGELAVPPEVRDFVLHNSEQNRLFGSSSTAFSGIKEWMIEKKNVLAQRIRRLTGEPERLAPVDPRIEFILTYMEDELEVSHDDVRH